MFSAVLMVAMTTTDMTPDLGHRRGGCHGCNGGYAACGCWGGCYGGCYGGWGGCYGGCYGGYGGCWGGYRGGGTYRISTSGYYGSYNMMPYTEYMPSDGSRRERIGDDNRGNRERNENTEERERVSQAAPARLIVQLPTDAKLTIDGNPTKSTSAERVFASPPLEPGRTFYYTLRATMVREDQPFTTEQRVRVRAGEVTRVKMEFPAAFTAQQ
jgi:uncharacterized protein (TIGR03000 family)